MPDMASDGRARVPADGRWERLSPLIEAVRPRGKTGHRDLRRTLEAIIWRHRNGAAWRAIPAELGPWWRAAQTFNRWSRLGVWQRLLRLAQERGTELGMAFLDGTTIRAHQKAAGAARRGATRGERDAREALGRSRGGYGTKACVLSDAGGRALAFALAPGQAHELPLASGLLGHLPEAPLWVVGDRGLASHAFRERVWDMGARPAIPPKRNEAPVACPPWIYGNRRLVENLWARLKEWRAVATRYEKTACSFMGVLCMAATMDRIK
jgi:transposase